MTNLLK